MIHLNTRPEMGRQFFRFRGDSFRFAMRVPARSAGQAFLRSNISQAKVRRREIIEEVEAGHHPLHEDWSDVAMESVGDGWFEVTLPLLDVGFFQAKPFFLPQGQMEPWWPDGENWGISVAPAMYRSYNGVYCAFVRQFGATKSGETSTGFWDEAKAARWDRRGFTLIPPSGTFRDLVAVLDHIFDDLHCRILHLLPIHPTPTVFGKMGRFGSPYASQDFTAVDPHLAEFDRRATPVDQFSEFVDAVHARGGRLILDMALNHTGWAAKIHETHPQWLKRDADGGIHSPGAWGVTWEDLTELDHTQETLWPYLYGVLETWCARGVDGFRCDAGYMIPEKAWTYIVAKIRQSYPDTLFLLEGLGGKLEVTRRLLSRANLNFAYSELFQNYSADQIVGYLKFANEVSSQSGLLVHYAETHDNNRLAATSKTYARMRVALCALFSQSGAFGFANGVEWFAREKIDVHGCSALNWDSRDNQVAEVAQLNRLLRDHPCFFDGVEIDVMGSPHAQIVLGVRRHRRFATEVLVAVNLDCDHAQEVLVTRRSVPQLLAAAGRWTDLLGGATLQPSRDGEGNYHWTMAPGQAMCLTAQPAHDAFLSDHLGAELRGVLALDLAARARSRVALGHLDRLQLGADLGQDAEAFCAKLGDVVRWTFPHDAKRQVMLPPHAVLLVQAPVPFRGRFAGMQRDSVAAADGTQFSAFFLDEPVPAMTQKILDLRLFETPGCRKIRAAVLCLADAPVVDSDVLTSVPATSRFLGTNGRGAMLRASLQWGKLPSRYDALLAANLHARVPVDRWIGWRRCRMWARRHGHSIALDETCTERVAIGEQLTTTFDVPLGTGRWMTLDVRLSMVPGENATLMTLTRKPANQAAMLPDEEAVRIIVRPDVEDRSFHGVTKAYLGPEHGWPAACAIPDLRTATFTPHPQRQMSFLTDAGTFTGEPEWCYNVEQEEEATRGFDPFTDVFSPGYFSWSLLGGQTVHLLGQIRPSWERRLSVKRAVQLKPAAETGEKGNGGKRVLWRKPFPVLVPDDPLAERLKRAMRQFIVARDDGKTVIAGYPWFLDWGRDTLIAVRGLNSAGFQTETVEILDQFARFADQGTLPNMIRGEDAQNRESSDAPLWFFVACEDVCRGPDGQDFLSREIEGRSLRQVLVDLAEGILDGTPNGISVDAESALVFSPPHFTWMDTNHPAGTPRCGYPIEIQALWHRALGFLATFDQSRDWNGLQKQVAKQVNRCFWLPREGFYSDCLHGHSGLPARSATPDDALRPNQLLGMTLGLLKGARARRALTQCERLIVPGGIRSLADREVAVPIPVRTASRSLLNDPQHPYWGIYEGDEDTRRKPAYHNGTAWTWPFPSFAEALVLLEGRRALPRARAILASVAVLLDTGCIGQIPEVLDGDTPHHPRGCDAQAWGVTETYRVWQWLHDR